VEKYDARENDNVVVVVEGGKIVLVRAHDNWRWNIGTVRRRTDNDELQALAHDIIMDTMISRTTATVGW
jgi:bifunctional DNA-binding transcriptional regulator/antitoxin component of YhaV-PrlF toxin-antitoxin module